MLLIIEALLILAALGQACVLDQSAAAVEGQINPLDMALDSVDDQYFGCKYELAKLVEEKYLKREIYNSDDFKSSWELGEKNFMSPKDHLTRNHLIAIYVYTTNNVYRKFNYDTRHCKNYYKHKAFKWYSLHFLLTEAIQILTKTQNQCMSTYRGTKGNYKVLNKVVRFGSFTSSSLDRKVAQGFGTKSCFEIKTCDGADITNYSKFPNEKEVLIPPYEKFIVTAVKTRKDQPDLWCDTVFTLVNNGKESYQNCDLFKERCKY